MDSIEITNVIMTIFSTAIGAIMGGLVTLVVSKKFEIERIRINNINDMKNDLTPALQQYVRILKSTRESLLSNEFYEIIAEQKEIAKKLEDSLAILNEKVDLYEIELSNMLDFHELILEKSFIFIEKLKEKDAIRDRQSCFIEFQVDLNILVDMIATFSEEISEIKINMLRGKIKNYWRKNIFENEKKDRVNYHR